ncbi:MAG: hypothetical protein ACM31H_01825 [Nitrososphaerales archaeon]|jgi:hypothetical protein
MSIQYDMTASEIKFISSIGTLGSDRIIINIPKKYHVQAKELKGKEVIVIIREALE